MSIKVNTEAVRSVANAMSLKNEEITKDFLELENKIAPLDRAWNGSASECAVQAFFNIKNTYNDRRSKVVEEFIGFMLTQVGERYEKTETAIHSAADAFK